VATVGVGLLTWIISAWNLEASKASVPILYLLIVIVAAVLSGRTAAVWASVSSFLAFNWFFVTPRYTFTVQEPSEWITLSMFLLTAIVTGQLMALLKVRASEAHERQKEATALSEASWAIASKLDTKSALNEVVKQIDKVIELEAAAVVVHQDGMRKVVAVYPANTSESFTAIAGKQNVDSLTDGIILPIEMNDTTFGNLFITLSSGNSLTAAQKRTVQTLLNHAAVILQKDGFMQIQTRAQALADADKLKTALLSMISHDFRSPLTSIKASVSTLLGEGKPLEHETKRGLYQTIEQETDRLNRIVGNILDLSRLEAGAWKPKYESVQVSELIGMALSPFSSEQNKRIVVKLDDKLNEINVDTVQIVQVLKNLVENALKYSPPDSMVHVETTMEHSEVKIKVLDRGRGISEEELPHIFEPFFRGTGLQESSVPGVGIGLAVCRGLVEAHGGNLTAENRAEGGAVFSITLPLQPAVPNRSATLCES
jgi:two-component system sensor histidine kinase KdpD